MREKSSFYPDLSGQERTSIPPRSTNLSNYAVKKIIEVGADYLKSQIIPHPNSVERKINGISNTPLKLQSAEIGLANSRELKDLVQLNDTFKSFLGNISYPFKMLLWGMPGSGKSTFSMKLADQVADQYKILYVSGEEGLGSATLTDKQSRTIRRSNRRDCDFINRLPNGETEWKTVLIKKEEGKQVTRHRAIFYDSITKLDITPFYVDAAASDCRMPFFNRSMSHIFISHAHKDGSSYRGDGSWGHEVDVIVKCENGIAIIEKNRFTNSDKGQVGSTFKIFEDFIAPEISYGKTDFFKIAQNALKK
jgi:predicted ATP-dependent serine protease